MNRMRLGISAAIIAVIIFVAFALSVPHTRDLPVKKEAPVAASVPVVTLKDSYKKGTHTISGSLLVPNACTPVTTSMAVATGTSGTPGIEVAITFDLDTGICLQVPTRVPFQSTVAAPSGISIIATVNGVVVSTSTP